MTSERSYDLIVFDWDGTLMDSAGAIVQAIFAACRDLSLPLPPESRARHVIGLGLQDALGHAVPELPVSDYPRMVERYRHHFLSRDKELELFPGVIDLVEQLAASDIWLGVATGKSRLGLNRALSHTGLGRYFHATRCADECSSKPHPQMLQELMAEFGVPPERTLMVGDTTHDIGMAHNAGARSLAVTFGAHPEAQLRSLAPLAVVDSPEEMAQWLLKEV